VWRMRSDRAGSHRLTFRVDGEDVDKELVVGDGLSRVNRVRAVGSLWDELLYPAEPPLPEAGAIDRLIVRYPLRASWFCGADYWLMWVIGLSFVFAILFKPFLKVEF
jgi:hypothetical protein